jgi:hypothetical protein
MKSEIIKELGQADILLRSLVADGLAANDRIKVRMSVLQAADRPELELAEVARWRAEAQTSTTAAFRHSA